MHLFKGYYICGAYQYELNSGYLFCANAGNVKELHAPIIRSAEFVASSKDTYVSGELKFFELTSDNGNTVSSSFCPTCGNPV